MDLKIYKVETLPETLEPGAIYFENVSGTVFVAETQTDFIEYHGLSWYEEPIS